MRLALERPLKDPVEFFGAQWNWWWVQPHFLVAVTLNQSSGIAWIGFQVQHPGGVRIIYGVVFNDLVIRQADDGFGSVSTRFTGL